MKTPLFIFAFLVSSLAIAAEDNSSCRSCKKGWFSSFFSSPLDMISDSAEASSASSFYYSGCGKLVEKAAIPLNQQDPDYQSRGWGFGDQLTLTTLDGVNVGGNWSRVDGSQKSIIMFHGNGMNADHYASWAQWFNSKDYNALALTIQGYPGSGGSSSNLPVASALLVETAFRFLMQDQGISVDDIAVYGFSLGGAYATYAGRYFQVPVILQNTLTTVGDMPSNILGSKFPGILGRALARSNLDYQEKMPTLESTGVFPGAINIPVNSFNNIDNLANTTSPVMILYGEQDDLMGGAVRAQELYSARYGFDTVVQHNLFVPIPNGGHCDVFLGNAEAERKVARFLRR